MHNPYAKYKSATFTTDNTILILIEAIDEAIKKLYEGRRCLEEKNIEGKYLAFNKAQDIFRLLSSGNEDDSDVQNISKLFYKISIDISRLQISFVEEEISEFINHVVNIRNIVKGAAKAEGMI